MNWNRNWGSNCREMDDDGQKIRPCLRIAPNLRYKDASSSSGRPALPCSGKLAFKQAERWRTNLKLDWDLGRLVMFHSVPFQSVVCVSFDGENFIIVTSQVSESLSEFLSLLIAIKRMVRCFPSYS